MALRWRTERNKSMQKYALEIVIVNRVQKLLTEMNETRLPDEVFRIVMKSMKEDLEHLVKWQSELEKAE
jgi:hypothetical protein